MLTYIYFIRFWIEVIKNVASLLTQLKPRLGKYYSDICNQASKSRKIHVGWSVANIKSWKTDFAKEVTQTTLAKHFRIKKIISGLFTIVTLTVELSPTLAQGFPHVQSLGKYEVQDASRT